MKVRYKWARFVVVKAYLWAEETSAYVVSLTPPKPRKKAK